MAKRGKRGPYRRNPLVDRFWAKVEKAKGCWEWKGARLSNGYGHIQIGGRNGGTILAHRLAYELTHGGILPVLNVCHHCDNKRCCNPAHLFLGTQADNMEDFKRKGNPGKSRRGGFKLTDQQVLEIYMRAKSGERQTKLAVEFGLHLVTVNAIARGRSRANVTSSHATVN